MITTVGKNKTNVSCIPTRKKSKENHNKIKKTEQTRYTDLSRPLTTTFLGRGFKLGVGSFCLLAFTLVLDGFADLADPCASDSGT